MGVIIGKKGRDISAKNAFDYISGTHWSISSTFLIKSLGYTLALDMTARNLQNKAKEKGLPWTQAKGYDTFCPISTQVIPKDQVQDPQNLELWLKVDGKLKQKGLTNQMIFK